MRGNDNRRIWDAPSGRNEGVILPATRPRVKPLLKAVAAVTAFALAVTGLLPAGWAQGTVPEGGLSPEEEQHLRVKSAQESSAETGLEEALLGSGTAVPDPNSTTRREFVAQSARSAGALAAAWLGIRGSDPVQGAVPASAQQRVAEDPLTALFKGPSAQAFLQQGMAFLRSQKIVDRRPLGSRRFLPEGVTAQQWDQARVEYRRRVGYDIGDQLNFTGFRREYEPTEQMDRDDRKLTDYRRVWPYGQGLTLRVFVLAAKQEKDPAKQRALWAEARELANALVAHGRQMEALGFKGGWPFSFNTLDDAYWDKRMPAGNTFWVLSSLHFYIAESGDERNLGWVNGKLSEVLKDLQVEDAADPLDGLIQAMPTLKAIVTEHQWDAVMAIFQAVKTNRKIRQRAAGRATTADIKEWTRRYQRLGNHLPKLWVKDAEDGDHFVTGVDGEGRPIMDSTGLKPSVAIDNNSWSVVLLLYNREMAWKAIQFVQRKFLVRDGGITGTSFFDKHFMDDFIRTEVPAEDPRRELWATMIQPEGTFGFIHFVREFARTEMDPALRREAAELAKELAEGMLKLAAAHNGKLPYSTKRGPLFLDAPSTTAVSSGLIELLGGEDFLLPQGIADDVLNGVTIQPPEEGREEMSFVPSSGTVSSVALLMTGLWVDSGGLKEIPAAGLSAAAGLEERPLPVAAPGAPSGGEETTKKFWARRNVPTPSNPAVEPVAKPSPIFSVKVTLPTPEEFWTREGRKPYRSKALKQLEPALRRAAATPDAALLRELLRLLGIKQERGEVRALRRIAINHLAERYRFSDQDLVFSDPDESRFTVANRLRRTAGLPVIAFERHWDDRGYLVQKAVLGAKATKAIVIARADREGLMGLSEKTTDRIQALRKEGVDVTLLQLGRVIPGAYARQAGAPEEGEGTLTVVVPEAETGSLRLEYSNDPFLSAAAQNGLVEKRVLGGAFSLGTKIDLERYLASALVRRGMEERKNLDVEVAEEIERDQAGRIGLGHAVAIGVVAGAALLGSAGSAQAQSPAAADGFPVITGPADAVVSTSMVVPERPPVSVKITLDRTVTHDGKPTLRATAEVSPPDRVVAPPTVVSRSPLRSALQGTKGFLSDVRNAMRRFFLGSPSWEKWAAVQTPDQSIMPAGQREVLFTINQVREFLKEGPQTVEATLAAMGKAAQQQGSQAALAVDIGAFVDFRDFHDLPSPVGITLTRDWILPLLEKARDHGVKVYVYSSTRGIQADMGSYVRNLADSLAMGFDQEAILTDWEIWATSSGAANDWERADRVGKKQMAWIWFQNHQRVLNETAPEKKATPRGVATRVIALVNAEFAEVLSEVLKERQQRLPERLRLVVMAYDYPPGQEAETAAAMVRAVSKRIDHSVGMAFNYQPGEDPSLHALARQGTAGRVVQKAVTLAGVDGQPIVQHLSHHNLVNLLRDGHLPPNAVTDTQTGQALSAAGTVGSMAIGIPADEPRYERKFIPVLDPIQESWRRYVVEPRGAGFLAGPGGLGSVIGAPWRNVNTWLNKGVWWFLDPDTLVWGPEAGITIASLKTILGTLAGGELEVVGMDLVVTPLDSTGRPAGTPQRIDNVLGRPDPIVDLKGDRWQGELEVTVRRPDGQIRNGNQLFPIMTSIEAEISLGYPGYGGTPKTASQAVSLSSIQEQAFVKIPIGELKPGPSFFNLKTRDQRGEITGWVGPGIDAVFAAQYTEALIERFSRQLQEAETILSDPQATGEAKAKARQMRDRLGGDVTALQLAAGYQGEFVAPISLDEFTEEEVVRVKLERLRRHGVTHLSLRIPHFETLANDFLLQFSDLGVADARQILGNRADQFLNIIRVAHEVGMKIGLQVNGAQVDQLTDSLRSPEAHRRVQAARDRGIQLNHGLDILKVIVQSNELFRLELDFFNLEISKPAQETRLRRDVEKLMEMLDTLLIVTGPVGGEPAPWAQYATRRSASEITPEETRKIFERSFPKLILRAHHRYPQAIFLDGENLDTILRILDRRFPSLIGSDGRVNEVLWRGLVTRLKVPSVTTLRALGVPEEQISQVQQKADRATPESLREALSPREEWAVFTVLGRAWEMDAAQQPLLARLQRPLDAAFMSAHRIQQTRMLMVGDTRPTLRLMTPEDQTVKLGSDATISVRVKNTGNLPARYHVSAYLMGKDSGGNPSWPAASPLVEQLLPILLKPGEEQSVIVRVTGGLLKEEGKIGYRILVRDANTLEHLPGQGLDLSPAEAERARVDGSLVVSAQPAPAVLAVQDQQFRDLQLGLLKEQFEKQEEARRARTGESLTDPAYQKGFEDRLRDFVKPFATVEVTETPDGRVLSFKAKPLGFQEQTQAARQEVRKKLEVISLMPEEPERFTAKMFRRILGWIVKGSIVAWIVGTLLGAYRSMRQGWQVARHQVRLRSEAVAFAQAGVDPHPPGAVTQAWNTARELSYFVSGIGADWQQRWAHLHPEQGKVSRAMEAHGKFVIVLDEETERRSQVVERTPLQRRHRFQRFMAQTTFWSLLGTLATGALALAGTIAVGWMAVPASILLIGVVAARAPALQRLGAWAAYLPVDLVHAHWANTIVFLAVPPLLLWSAWALITTALVPAAAAAWIPIASVSAVALLWALMTYMGARDAGITTDLSGTSTLWRTLGALGLGAVGAAAVAYLTTVSLPLWQFFAGFVAVFFLVRTATRIFVQSEHPLQDYAQWLWDARFLVKWAGIAVAAYYGFTVFHPLLFGAWKILAGAALPAAGSLAATTAQMVVQTAGVAATAYLLAVRFEFMQDAPGWFRWPVTVGVAVGVVFAMPVLLSAMGLPLVWGSFFLGIGIFSYAIGQWGKASELWRGRSAGERFWAAAFRGLFLGVAVAVGFPAGLFWVFHGSAALAVGLAYWVGIIPVALLTLFFLGDQMRRVGFWIHDQFEREEIQQIQYGLAIQHLVDTVPAVSTALNLAAASLADLQVDFNRLAGLAALADPDRAQLLRHFNIRLSPDQRPLAHYDSALFDQAWSLAVDVTRREWHRGVPPIDRGLSFITYTPAMRTASLSPDQQRVVNWYYWWLLARQEAEAEVRRQSSRAAGLADLPAADREMAITRFFNQSIKRNKDEIFNQDDGTALRAFGGSLFTGDLRELSTRMRRDDSMAVIMPALILSLEFNRDLNWQSVRRLWERFGLIGGSLAAGTLFLQVALVNFAVPLGFIASMANRWGRGVVQGGNVLHTLRASADAGMAGYQSAMAYVILVIGRWLIGLLYTLMEVYLGRWVGRGDLDEYFADQYWVPKAGTIEQWVHYLLQQGDGRSLTAAMYAAIIGEENSIFDMGLFQLPPLELRQVPWNLRADVAGVTDSETFSRRLEHQQLPGVVGWRTDSPAMNGGHELIPVRVEIVDTLDLGNGLVAERLSDGQTFRFRDPEGTLQYFQPLNPAEQQLLNDVLVAQGGNWTRSYTALRQEVDFLLANLRVPHTDAETRRLQGRLNLYQNLLRKIQVLPEGNQLFASAGGIYLNNVLQPLVSVERLSQEPGKFHLVLPPGQTKGANVGAGMADYLGMVEPQLEVIHQNDRWRARVVYEKLEDELYPEWEEARRAVQDPDDRLAGERAEAGRLAASEIIVWNDTQIRAGRGSTSLADLPQGEMGHNQVGDATGQRFQLRLNFFRWLLNMETRPKEPANRWLLGTWLAAAATTVAWVGIHLSFPWLAVGIAVGAILFAGSSSWYWSIKVGLALSLAGYFAWPWALALFIIGPTFLAFLWGRIHPISFIGFVPYNRLQGMKGHYDSELVENAFDQIEQRMTALQLPVAPRPADAVYDQDLATGQAAIEANPRLTLIAHLYHRVLKYDHLSYGPGWSNSSPLIRRLMPVEPRLAQAIGSLFPGESLERRTARRFLERALQRMGRWPDNAGLIRRSLQAAVRSLERAPANERNRQALAALRQALNAVQSGRFSVLIQHHLNEAARLLRPEEPQNRWEARRMLEQAIADELAVLTPPAGVPVETARRNVFEALRWRTTGELMALGNVAVSTQYSRSRSNRVIRVGDVWAQYGVEGQRRLKRMLWTQQRANNGRVVADRYPDLGNRSWTRHSEGALYEGIPASSMMYSRTGDALLAAIVRGAQRGGILIEWAAHSNDGTLYLFSDYLIADRGNLGTPDRGRGVLELAREAGLIGEERFELLWERIDGEEGRLRLQGLGNPAIGVAVSNMARQMVRQELGLREIILSAPDDKKTKVLRPVEVVRRIDPLEAALTQRRPGQTIRDFYLEQTLLQPDLETVGEYERARSRQMAAQVDTALTVQQVDANHAIREHREGRSNILRLDPENINWQIVGFAGSRLQDALSEFKETIERDGEFSLAASSGPVQGLLSWLTLKQRYSKEAILLSLLYGVTEQQVIRDRQGRIVDLRWTNFDSHWDGSEWPLAVGPYLWPGSTMGRVTLWMRRAKMSRAPPITFMEATRLLEMPPWLAVASGFNRLYSDGLSLPQLLTEDGRHGSLNRLRPTLNPTMNAWNAHWAAFMMLGLFLRKRDKATSRALGFFTGMAMEQAFEHLFDHPLFGVNRNGQDMGRPVYTQEQGEIQEIFPRMLGLQTFLRDEIETAGAQGAGTFSYGFSGYTASWLAGRRVGPMPPGHVAAYWKYREFRDLDRQLTPIQYRGGFGLLSKTIRLLQRQHQTSLTADPFPEDLLHGQVVDPWAAMAVMGSIIERAGRRSASVHPSRQEVVQAAYDWVDQQLSSAPLYDLTGLEETYDIFLRDHWEVLRRVGPLTLSAERAVDLGRWLAVSGTLPEDRVRLDLGQNEPYARVIFTRGSTEKPAAVDVTTFKKLGWFQSTFEGVPARIVEAGGTLDPGDYILALDRMSDAEVIAEGLEALKLLADRTSPRGRAYDRHSTPFLWDLPGAFASTVYEEGRSQYRSREVAGAARDILDGLATDRALDQYSRAFLVLFLSRVAIAIEGARINPGTHRSGLEEEPPTTLTPATTTSLTSPVSVSHPAPAVESVRGEPVEPRTVLPAWLLELEERQLIVLAPEAAQRYPGLAEIAGQIRSMENLSFVVLPLDRAGIQQLVSTLATDPQPTTVLEFGAELDESLNYFDTLAEGAFTQLPRRPLEGTDFRALMRQIIANLAGVQPDSVSDDELAAVADALGLGAQV